MRTQTSFTHRQMKFLQAIREKIRHIHDPDPEIITHESYEWYTQHTTQFGKIPKIRFHPNSCLTKAEIIDHAGLTTDTREKEITDIHKNLGITKPRDKESRIKARLFEAEWNNIMLKAKKATITAALINQTFCTTNQTISEPVELLQHIVMQEYATQPKAKNDQTYGKEGMKCGTQTQKTKKSKPYDEELWGLE